MVEKNPEDGTFGLSYVERHIVWSRLAGSGTKIPLLGRVKLISRREHFIDSLPEDARHGPPAAQANTTFWLPNSLAEAVRKAFKEYLEGGCGGVLNHEPPFSPESEILKTAQGEHEVATGAIVTLDEIIACTTTAEI